MASKGKKKTPEKRHVKVEPHYFSFFDVQKSKISFLSDSSAFTRFMLMLMRNIDKQSPMSRFHTIYDAIEFYTETFKMGLEARRLESISNQMRAS